LEKAGEAARKSGIEELFVFGESTAVATSFGSLLQGEAYTVDVEINPREDLVALPYSSGTTGLPKA